MGILDDAIREHIDLKRKHGARDSEISEIEDEALGSGERPDPFAAGELFGGVSSPGASAPDLPEPEMGPPTPPPDGPATSPPTALRNRQRRSRPRWSSPRPRPPSLPAAPPSLAAAPRAAAEPRELTTARAPLRSRAARPSPSRSKT